MEDLVKKRGATRVKNRYFSKGSLLLKYFSSALHHKHSTPLLEIDILPHKIQRYSSQEKYKLIHNNGIIIKTHVPGSYIGNYLLLRLLGDGGFASVYLGEHRYLKRLVAIKVLRTMLAEQEKGHFLEEAQLLAKLSHPHIVRVLEFDIVHKRTFVQNSVVIENIPFLVMDYIADGNLRTIYPMGTRLSLPTIIPAIKQAAEALFYAHTQGIIHRDIKPENLLVVGQQIMVSDFGLALFAPHPDLISLKSMVGTVPYSAPEQLQGKPTFASDQYSLAIMAYEWLYGHLPFRGTDIEIIMQHISSPPLLEDDNGFLPQQVQNVLLKALAKNPTQRFETILDFALALEEVSQVQRSDAINPPLTVTHPPLQANALPMFYYLSPKAVSARVDEDAVFPRQQQNRSVVLSPGQRNRQRMLQRVHAMWIDGVLEPSLSGGPLITPELSERPDAVATPWPSMQYHLKKKSARPSRERSIIEAYDEAGGDLLILGEAGSGKTTLLLQLSRHLLTRAEGNDTFPLPVIFLLSSWATKQLPIDQWLIEELNDKYRVPRLLAEQWLHSEMLLPLLDGLDEVSPKVRSSCIIAINAYKQQHGFTPLVVCSRLTDYLLFPPRVLLQRAIVVQSLAPQQIDAYFKNAGANFASIYQILCGDLRLYEFITTPLMLTIITSTYQNRSSADLLMIPSPQLYQTILTTYVTQMLHRHPMESANTHQQLISGLTSLAKNMQQESNTFFYVEHLQPTWIPNTAWREVYRWLAVLLPGIVIGALPGLLISIFFNQAGLSFVQQDTVYGMIMGCLFSNRRPDALSANVSLSPPTHSITSPVTRVSLQVALFVSLTTLVWIGSQKGWTAGLISGLLLGLLSLPIQRLLQRPNHSPRSSPHPLNKLFPLEHIKNSLPIAIACGLTNIATLLLNPDSSKNALTFFLRDSLHTTLLGILLSMLLKNNVGIIHCAESISWSWKRFFAAFKFMDILLNLLVGLIIGFLNEGIQLFQNNLSNSIISIGSSVILITISIRLTVAIFQGIASNTLNDHHRTVPNEGIKRSLFHGNVSFSLGLVFFSGLTIIASIFSLLSTAGPAALANQRSLQSCLSSGLLNALLLGPAGGLLIALSLGWLASWQHAVLRLILRITNTLPLKLSPFLNDATASVLLRQVGGGYMFIHRTLLEYFVSHADTLLPDKESAQTSLDAELLV